MRCILDFIFFARYQPHLLTLTISNDWALAKVNSVLGNLSLARQIEQKGFEACSEDILGNLDKNEYSYMTWS